MSKVDFVSKRASAEGYSIDQVKKALLEVKESCITGGCSKPMQPVTVESLARDIVTSTHTGAGYLYSGDTWIGISGIERFYQELSTVNGVVNEVGNEEDLIQILNLASIGTELYHGFRGENNESYRFKKTTRGWIWTEYYSELDEKQETDNWFTPGIRQRVAEKLGVSPSPTFHLLFNRVVEHLR